MIVLQVLDLCRERRRALVKDFVELLRSQLPCSHQVFHRQLQWKQRILQFMRKPSCQFTPCRHALALHQPLALLLQLRRHAVEGFGKIGNLSACALRIHAHVPVSCRNLSRSRRQFHDRTRHAPGDPQTHRNRQQDSQSSHGERNARICVFSAIKPRRGLPISNTLTTEPLLSIRGIAVVNRLSLRSEVGETMALTSLRRCRAS